MFMQTGILHRPVLPINFLGCVTVGEVAMIIYFPFKQIFNKWVVSAMAPPASSSDLVLVGVTGPSVGVSVCLRNDNIGFVLYRSMR